MKKSRLVLVGVALAVLGLSLVWLNAGRAGSAQAAAAILASPVHGGCYIAGPSDCRLHVEPITINVTPGKKLVYFQLIATRAVGGAQRVIYDFRPDLSNPLPYSGSTVPVSMVAQDFAATCGVAYSISLQGRDTGDSAVYNLGSTGVFTCPAMVP
ncbi:MAG: hypothetical protein BWY10_02081 [Chloroflexi bacterium ADurb.Bin180]|nr:MAG: hypothetical protein BWY10_02081 [Chloroflexi bacterium ADurb.Bin180]HNT06069.1 hypothetical protein [Anaerolineae bacterium]